MSSEKHGSLVSKKRTFKEGLQGFKREIIRSTKDRKGEPPEQEKEKDRKITLQQLKKGAGEGWVRRVWKPKLGMWWARLWRLNKQRDKIKYRNMVMEKIIGMEYWQKRSDGSLWIFLSIEKNIQRYNPWKHTEIEKAESEDQKARDVSKTFMNSNHLRACWWIY